MSKSIIKLTADGKLSIPEWSDQYEHIIKLIGEKYPSGISIPNPKGILAISPGCKVQS